MTDPIYDRLHAATLAIGDSICETLADEQVRQSAQRYLRVLMTAVLMRDEGLYPGEGEDDPLVALRVYLPRSGAEAVKRYQAALFPSQTVEEVVARIIGAEMGATGHFQRPRPTGKR